MKIKVLGIPVKVTTAAVFGAGYLLGSRSGPAAWEAAVAKWNELRGLVGGAAGQPGPATNGATGDAEADLRSGVTGPP